jgi:protein-S-isoprenylcysteine O-methyltransferase Ste14
VLILKLFLFSGLVLHKIVWEVLRNRGESNPTVEPGSLSLLAVKAVKIAILLGILVQVWLPDVLPISGDPFVIRVIGTAIYSAGLLVAIAARFQLGDNWSNIETGQVLTNQHVVSRGIYSYIRHPIYTGDLLLLVGLELALNSWLVLGVLLLIPVVLLKAIKEEQMLQRELAGYGDYCRETKRFIPFLV